MQPARLLREKLARGELITGILATHHLWPDLIEICQRSGIDYLIVDMEHGVASIDRIAEVCALGRVAGFPVLIRPRANDYANLRIAIDIGPCGFLLASVDSVEELDGVRDAIYVPPRGRRRPGGAGNRWVDDYTASTWQHEVEEPFLILPQIETRVGLENASGIARHELTTALAVGPYDLSAELGVCGEMQSPRLVEALHQLRAIATEAGKPMWMIGSDPVPLIEAGWRFLCVGEPTWVLEAGLRERVAAARAALPAGESAGLPMSTPPLQV